MYRYILTNDDITIFSKDGKQHVFTKQSVNYKALRNAVINKDEQAITDNLTESSSIKKWASGAFTFDDATQKFSWSGSQLPIDINARIIAMAQNQEDPTCLLNFYEKLQKNVSHRSVTQLYGFLAHQGIPITPEGNILAYKGVNADYTDKYSGKFNNFPGNVHEMPRNQISDDPNHACHAGFHVGSESYAKTFGNRVVICSVDPADVVCVPYDQSSQKMRVCKYKVIGNHGDVTLPSTTIKSVDIPVTQDICQNKEAPAPQATESAVYTLDDLLERSVDELRKIAFHDFKIIGVSRMSGGKLALVERILNVMYNR
jgi:hypothetical protein